MSNESEKSKKIAKNTFILYVRMMFLMLISLYTSRVVLSSLGIIDYGIYNIVGGVVSMFSTVNDTHIPVFFPSLNAAYTVPFALKVWDVLLLQFCANPEPATVASVVVTKE